MKKHLNKQVAVYQLDNGAIQLKMDGRGTTLWANLTQIAELFGVEKPGISKHINKIYESNELARKGTVSKMETVQIEGNREVVRKIEYFNLDVILSVGYRVNSVKATRFRQWATKTLKEHIEKGYTLNRQRIKANHEEFLNAVEKVKSLLPVGDGVSHDSILELIKLFADTWFSLDAYDDVYRSLEEKAANLLYFIIKNHPFVDGNKRSGAYAFIWFLNQAKILDTQKITPPALTALTLLIAESNPKDKEKMIGLVCALLK